jgi:hypothetical protein
MKFITSSALLVAALLLARGQARSAADSLPNPYQPPIESWGQLPEGRHWGGIGGTSFDSKGHLWAFERCGGANCIGSDVAPIIELDTATGQPLKMFGSGLFVIPHAIFVDKNDHDNIWVVDQGAHEDKGEQVWKFSPDGKVLLTLGKPGQKGETPDTFNDPCSVITGKNGDIFVSDGHVGRDQKVARILKFSKDGKFIKTWGKKGTDPGDLDDPHSITLDADGRLFVADRGNLRISIFDQDGKLLDIWKQFGIPSGVFVDDKDTLYVGENFLRPAAPDFQRGIRIGGARDGKVTAFIIDPDQDPKDGTIGPESVRVDKDGTLYAGEVDRRMIKKYVLK